MPILEHNCKCMNIGKITLFTRLFRIIKLRTNTVSIEITNNIVINMENNNPQNV
jgi:hypothetical protein